jgi:hypothetical protein
MKEKYEDSLYIWKDKAEKEHFTNTLLVASSKEAKEVYGKELAQKAKELKVAQSAIKSSVTIRTETKILPGDLVYKTDTIPCKDSFAIVRVVDTTQSPTIKDSLGLVQYLKPNGWFRDPTPTLDVVSYYGRTNVSYLKGITIQDKYSKWALGAGVGYAFPTNSIQFSIGLYYKLITIGGKK